LAAYSERLTLKIGGLLQASFGDQVRVRLALTYGNPSIEFAIQSLAEDNAKKLLVLPLFPRCCSSTAGSVFDHTTRVLRRWRWLPETRIVNDYYYDPGCIDALAAQTDDDSHARVLARLATDQLHSWTAGDAP
jgi:ferrochelatase